MMSRRLNLVSLSCVGVSLAVLSGCEPGPSGSTVKIHYSQVGACNGYQSGSGVTSKRANQAFAVFRIESIDSTQSGVGFNFTPSRLYVDLEPHKETWGSSLGASFRFVSSDRRFTDPLGVPAIAESKVPARATTPVDRLAFIPVSTKEANGAEEVAKTSYKLLYDPVTKQTSEVFDPHVELVKSNEAQSSWPTTDDCLHLDIGPAK
jgi:hypothetical protein